MVGRQPLLMTYKLLFAGMFAILLCAGCTSSHVSIKLPRTTAPTEDRVEAFRQYRRKGLGYRIYIERLCLRFRDDWGRRLRPPQRYVTRELQCPEGREIGTRQGREYMPSSLLLGNGRFVYFLEDLLPAVRADSKTAFLIRHSLANSTKAKAAFGIGLAVSASVGVVFTSIGFAMGAFINSDTGTALAITGFATAGVGSVVSAITGAVFGARSNNFRYRAYRTYNRDLLHKLDITPDDLRQNPPRSHPRRQE